MRLKRFLSAAIAAIMVSGLLPSAVLAAQKEEGTVTASKFLQNTEPDEDGNYTVKMTIEGVQYTESTEAGADVVLAVDTSGSMSSKVSKSKKCQSTSFKEEERQWTDWFGGIHEYTVYVCEECQAEFDRKPNNICGRRLAGKTRMEVAKEAAEGFVDQILNGEQDNTLAVIGFNGAYGTAEDKDAIDISTGLETDGDTLKDEIAQMQSGGGTNYTAALAEAKKILDGRENTDRPAYIIFISDGKPGYSGDGEDDKNWNGTKQAEELINDGVIIYTIGIEMKDDADALKAISSYKDGKALFTNVTDDDLNEGGLPDILEDLAEIINRIPAGANAVITDVINTDEFEYVSGSASDGLELDDDGKTLIWNIGNIPEEKITVTFKVKAKDGVYGNSLHTNESIKLEYIDNKTGEKIIIDGDEAREKIGDPTVDIKKPSEPEPETPGPASKSKTAAELDENYVSEVTLSLPSEETELMSDVVFVMDKSSCKDEVAAETKKLLENLLDAVSNTEAKINVGVIVFGGDAKTVYGLKELDNSELDAIYNAAANRPDGLLSGTNMEAGLIEAENMLKASQTNDERKYVIVVSDGLTRLFTGDDGNVKIIFHQIEADGIRYFGEMTGWCVANGFGDGEFKVPGGDWDNYFDKVTGWVESDGDKFTVDFTGESTTANPEKYVPLEEIDQHALSVDRAFYDAYQAYDTLKSEYNCCGVYVGSSELGEAFMSALNGGRTVDFNIIQKKINYLLDNGSKVVDEIGIGTDNHGNSYNFDFVNEAEKITLSVGSNIYNAEAVQPQDGASASYGFAPDGNSGYKYELHYYEDGTVFDGRSCGECFIWEINVPVTNFERVQLKYNVKLTDPQTENGTYIVETNKWAALYPEDSLGNQGESQEFEKPEVSYTNEAAKEYTVRFEEGKHGELDGRTEFTYDEGQIIDTVPDVDADSGYRFDLWYCEELDKYYSTSQVKNITVDRDLTFVAAYSRKGSGGGGGYELPEGRIEKEKPKLETEEHFQYISGYPDGLVRPNANITRAEVATIFYRLLEDSSRQLYYTTYQDFSDVNNTRWYLKAVATLTNADILHGDGNAENTFRPDDSITRAEFATIVSFFDDLSNSDENHFSDINGHWAADYINSAYEKGWIAGYPDGTFHPDSAITRSEAVTLINNVLNREVDKDGLCYNTKMWPDNPEYTWYYYEILEATNYHEYTRDDDEAEYWTEIRPNKIWNEGSAY